MRRSQPTVPAEKPEKHPGDRFLQATIFRRTCPLGKKGHFEVELVPGTSGHINYLFVLKISEVNMGKKGLAGFTAFLFFIIIFCTSVFVFSEEISDKYKEANKVIFEAMKLINEGKMDTGLELLKQSIIIAPEEPDMHSNYGGMLFTRGSQLVKTGEKEKGKSIIKEAENELLLAIKLYKENPTKDANRFSIAQCHFLLGDIYFYVYEDKEKAKSFYQKALEYYPEYELAKEALGRFAGEPKQIRGIDYSVSSRWVFMPEGTKEGQVYVYASEKDPIKLRQGSAAIIVFRLLRVPETAIQWAIDEAKGFGKEGGQIIVQPTEINIGNFKWVVLKSVASIKRKTGVIEKHLNEQYFYKEENGTIIEVSIIAKEDYFNEAFRKEINDFLSSFKIGQKEI